MAEKILNTRIILKNADLAEWNSSTLVLKAGEVALARIETTQHNAETGTYYNVPTYLMKVGDGSNTFSNLNWLAAPASDVHTWAKKASLDYNDLPETLRTEIDNLQAAVGEGGNVDTKINAAIDALKEACTVADTAVANEFVTAVAQNDGKIAITRRALTAADIPSLEISKISGLQDALDAKAAKSTVDELVTTVGNAESGLVKDLAQEVTDRKAAVKSVEDKVKVIEDTTIPNLRTDITNAQSAASTAQSEVDALEQVVEQLTTTVGNNKTAAETAISNEAKARADGDTALDTKITELKNAIGNLSNIMNFRGAFASTSECTDPVNGDVIVITSGEDNGKEFVYDGTSWVEFGNVNAQQTAIANLQERMTTAEGKITNLETNSATKTELTTAVSGLEDKINAKADETTVTGIGNRVTELEGKVGNAESGLVKDVSDLKTTVGSSTSGLVKDVADLKTNSATKAEVKAVQDALDAEELRADTEEKRLAGLISGNTTAINGLDTRLDTAEGKISALETASETHATKASVQAVDDKVEAIKGNYVKINETNNLVDQAGDVIIFDCGGAQ